MFVDLSLSNLNYLHSNVLSLFTTPIRQILDQLVASTRNTRLLVAALLLVTSPFTHTSIYLASYLAIHLFIYIITNKTVSLIYKNYEVNQSVHNL